MLLSEFLEKNTKKEPSYLDGSPLNVKGISYEVPKYARGGSSLAAKAKSAVSAARGGSGKGGSSGGAFGGLKGMASAVKNKLTAKNMLYGGLGLMAGNYLYNHGLDLWREFADLFSTEDAAVEVAIDDDGAFMPNFLSSQKPNLKIKIVNVGNFIPSNRYTYTLASQEAAYLIRKALRLPLGTRADNQYYSVDPGLLAKVLSKLDSSAFDDPGDKSDIDKNIIPVLTALATAMKTESTFKNKPGGTTYVVGKDDDANTIARKFNVRVDDLLRINGLSRIDDIEPGMTLKIPGTDYSSNTRNFGLTGLGGITGSSGGGFSGSGGGSSIRNSYMEWNKKRLAKKADRNKKKAEELRDKASKTTSETRRRRLENRATRAEARSMKAAYKSENLR